MEVNDSFSHQSVSISELLIENGFRLKEKRSSELISSDNRFSNTFNQIWVKSEH